MLAGGQELQNRREPSRGFSTDPRTQKSLTKGRCGERSSKQVYASTAIPTPLILSKRQGVLCRNFEDWFTKPSSALLS